MRSKNITKICWATVCLALVLGLLPVTSLRASALGGTVASSEELVEVLGGNGCAEIVGSPDGEVVQLLQDVFLGIDTVGIIDGEVMLDLNGYGIYAETTAIVVESGASLDIMDTSGGDGVLVGYSENGAGTVINYGELEIHSGFYVSEGEQSAIFKNYGNMVIHYCETWTMGIGLLICDGFTSVENGFIRSEGYSAIGVESGVLDIHSGCFEGEMFGIYADNRFSYGGEMIVTIYSGSFSGRTQVGAAFFCDPEKDTRVTVNDGVFIGAEAGLYMNNVGHTASLNGGQFSCDGDGGLGGIVSYLGESEGNSVDVIGMHVGELLGEGCYLEPSGTDVYVEQGGTVNYFYDRTGSMVYVFAEEIDYDSFEWVVKEVSSIEFAPLELSADGDWYPQCEAYALEHVRMKLEELGYWEDAVNVTVVYNGFVSPYDMEPGEMGEFSFFVDFGNGYMSDYMCFDVWVSQREPAETAPPEWSGPETGDDLIITDPPEWNEWEPENPIHGGADGFDGSFSSILPQWLLDMNWISVVTWVGVILLMLVLGLLNLVLLGAIITVIVLKVRKNRK